MLGPLQVQPQTNMAEIVTEAEADEVAAAVIIAPQTLARVPAVVVAVEVEIRKNN